jgi:chromosome partitioning protein
MSKQVILGILANAGGVGKSTLATHLAFALSQKKQSVVLIDLDPQRSLDVFCGLVPANYEASVAAIFSKDFKGNWPLTTAWENAQIQVCQGHPSMSQVADDLVIRRRGEYVLADRLKYFPLNCDVVIIDCPATLGKLCENAVAASTHLLIPLQMEMKSVAGVSELLIWGKGITEDLQIPPPPILGLVPSLYDKKRAMHRQYLAEMPSIASALGLKVYQTIPDSTEFANASAFGIPLQKHRPGHPGTQCFDELVNDVLTQGKG